MLHEKIKSHKNPLLGLKFDVGRKISKAVDDLRENGIPTGINCRAFVLNIHGRHKSLNGCMFHKIELTFIFTGGKYRGGFPVNTVAIVSSVFGWSTFDVAS